MSPGNSSTPVSCRTVTEINSRWTPFGNHRLKPLLYNTTHSGKGAKCKIVITIIETGLFALSPIFLLFSAPTCVASGLYLVVRNASQGCAGVPWRLLTEDLMPFAWRTSTASPTAVLVSIVWPLWTSCMACSHCESKSFHICGYVIMARSTTITW